MALRGHVGRCRAVQGHRCAGYSPSVYQLALLNQKGGVGKTATTINLGAALAEAGYSVLAVDLDPQGHLTEACGLPESGPPDTLAGLLLADPDTVTPARVERAVRPWQTRMDVLVSSEDMFLLERQLYRARAPENRLKFIAEAIEKLDRYDVVLYDCPPSLGVLSDCALVAALQALVPVQSEDSSLRAIRLLLKQIKTIQAELRTQFDLLGMVVNLYDKRRGQVVTSTLDALKAMPLEILAVISDRTAVREAWRVGLPVILHAPQSPSAQEYRQLAKALMEGSQ